MFGAQRAKDFVMMQFGEIIVRLGIWICALFLIIDNGLGRAG